MSPTTDSEKHTIVQNLRTRFPDERLVCGNFCRRYLEAGDYNIDKAEHMIRKTLKWRQDNGIDSLLDKKFDTYFTTNYPFYIKGADRSGNPVLVIPYGKWDVKKAVGDGKGEELVEYFVTIYERIRLMNEAKDLQDGGLAGFTGVADFEGYSYAQVLSLKVLQLSMLVTGYFENHYPLILNKAIFINCPRVFSILWKAVKPLMSQQSQERMIMRGSNRREWEADVRKEIDPAQIPAQFGGTLPPY